MKSFKCRLYLKLLVVFLLLSLVPMALLGGVSYHSAQHVVQEHIGNKLEELARLSMRVVEQEIIHFYQNLRAWTHLEIMQDVLINDKNKKINRALEEFQKDYPGYRHILCLNQEGDVIASSKSTLTFTNKLQTKWFKKAISGQVYVGELNHCEEDKLLGITVAFPINSAKDTKQIIGVLSATFNWEEIYPLLEDVKIGEGPQRQHIDAHIMLINQEGLVLFAPESEREEKKILESNLFDKIFNATSLTLDSGYIISQNENNQSSLIGYTYSRQHKDCPGLDCIALTIHATNTAFARILKLKTLIVVCIAILILLVIVASNLFAKQLTKPIKQLTKAVKRIAQEGHRFSARGGETLHIDTGDEIGELSRAFNYMCQVLKNREDKLIASYYELEQTNEALRDNTKDLEYTLKEIKRVVQLAIKEKNLKARFCNPSLEKCWEIKKCNENKCPAYENSDRRCWQIAGTLCRHEVQGNFAQKMRDCKKCEPYQKASFNRYYAIGEMFNDLLELLQEKQEELHGYAHNLEEKVTERTQALEASHQELEKVQAEQLKMKDQFLSHVSHELRSPLTAIYQFVTIILDGLAGDINLEQREYLEIIHRNTKQLRTMIGDLLEATRAEAGTLVMEPTQILLNELINETVCTHQPTAQKQDIVLSVNLSEGNMLTYADPIRVQEILTNLVGNSLKFTPEGGTITIGVDIYQKDPSFACVSVSDNGCGISPHGITTIFERMFQEKIAAKAHEVSRQGLGLGLYICKELVTRQGGKIWVESKLGEGSSFFFTLPRIATKKIDVDE